MISNTGFFPDHQWIEIAETMRTPGQGEALVDSLSREGFATLLEEASDAIDETAMDEYWKAFTSAEGRRGMLELYRSFDLAEVEPYWEKLTTLDVPVLVLWGEADDFLPVDYARRFADETARATLVLLEGVRHFLYEDEPQRCAAELIAFLDEADI